jgi:hypothetical protein
MREKVYDNSYKALSFICCLISVGKLSALNILGLGICEIVVILVMCGL